ncbi:MULTISPECIES: type II toxin-antitoxin system RelE/ParE family toxin [unclassified Leisingera]|uniref:type II toxin-antitoxin system RelE/ParE family toxin n=1 Tax=unclassified Leisingera TaxID=2614906 RepID=UPI0002F87B2A|nr:MULTISPECIES: type II toxin-antitoxin system RelE/ParE family toxin [unclassified Leisingera]KIC21941.1 plasmid stabilization protein ParE [Leisingera sp. ANG-S3]KIC23270.1 plasmid stabilization protein ParE [Leisingera sp. ANG-M6]KIC32405.1 plasmid stabilization protein ParE [Leisingera sp. ANG-S5]KIC50264.1 plasmid stabilization protein ParE [Leisingera sp. ANG-S]KID07628.1 plasmid stabilization protein ParE [Leisingera sp. ANG1]
MAELRWRIRPAARADLAAIWRYGLETWGETQADAYADSLFALFDLLADFPEMARERAEFTPPVRIHPTGAHLVIYRIEQNCPEIIRILHARQDLMAFLSE